MSEARIVNFGVDTLIVNGYHTDDQGNRIKRDIDESLRVQLNEWKKEAQGLHDALPTSYVFRGAVLHMSPNGAGAGQWPWMLKTPDITVYVSGGHWNGVVSVRLSSQYLWSCSSLLQAIVEVQVFLDEVFHDEMFLQVSQVDLCADVVGWSDFDRLDQGKDFVSRSRKRGVYAQGDWGYDGDTRTYMLGQKRTGFQFARSKSGLSPLEARIYDKTREVIGSGKQWFHDLWRTRGWSEEEGTVIRVEFSFRRQALHELLQEDGGEVVFHGIEDVYVMLGLLPLLWAYATGQVDGGSDGLPDGWLRCAVPNGDKNRSRWSTHPVWKVVQRAFTEHLDIPPHFGRIVRKRWEDHNLEKALEAMVGYLSSIAAWAGGDLAEEGTDLSVVLHWLAVKGQDYLDRVDRDFSAEIQRKRVKLGLETGKLMTGHAV
jgi:hypothetical protein